MKFQQLSTSAGTKHVRAGEILIPQKPSLPTPTAMIFTRRGCIPHLTTPDLFMNASNCVSQMPLYVPFAHTLADFDSHLLGGRRNAFDNADKSSSRDTTDSILKKLQLDKCITFAGFHDLFAEEHNGDNGTSFVSMNTWRGCQKIQIPDFDKHVINLNADVVTPMVAFLNKHPDVDGKWSAKKIAKSVDRTISYLDKFLQTRKAEQKVFGVIVGSQCREEFTRCAKLTVERPVDGFVIDCSVDSPFLKDVLELLPPDRSKVMMGVDSLKDLFTLLDHGIDIVDAFWVQNLAEENRSITLSPNIGCHVENAQLETNMTDFSLMSTDCQCAACADGYTKAYIHHLLNAKEILGTVLLASHNLFQFGQFMKILRKSIIDDKYEEFKKIYVSD